MNYEIFIWLEPVASTLSGCAVGALIMAVIGVIVTAIILGVNAAESYRDNKDNIVVAASWFKRSIAVGLVSVLILLSSSVFSNFSDVYKKVLIYRGINSMLTDKAIDTADKALDVLNAKLDKEMTAIKAEKE